MLQWIRNPKGRLIKASVLQEFNSELNMSFNQMEHLEGEQHCQYLMERKPNAYRSMRDYRNPPWVSVPSYLVPPTNAPYENAYNPSWGNHSNLSWGNHSMLLHLSLNLMEIKSKTQRNSVLKFLRKSYFRRYPCKHILISKGEDQTYTCYCYRRFVG